MSLYKNAARAEFAEGIRTGAARAGVTDRAAIADLQSALDAKWWPAFEAEANPSASEARELAADLVQHHIDQHQGRNTPERLGTLRNAAWATERGKHWSNNATNASLASCDAGMRTDMPRLHTLLKDGAGNRPRIVRFATERHAAAKAKRK